MLPDYETLKEEIKQHIIRKYIRNRIHVHFPMLKKIQRRRIFEGATSRVQNIERNEEDSLINKIESQISISFDQIPQMEFSDLLVKMDTIAQDMAKQHAKILFNTLNTCVQNTGNVIEAGGASFSRDMVLEMLKKIHLEFDSNGIPHVLDLIVNHKSSKKIIDEMDAAFRDPEFQRKYNDLIQEKLEEFCVREAARKLVG